MCIKLGYIVWKEFQDEFRVGYVGVVYGIIVDFLIFFGISIFYFILIDEKNFKEFDFQFLIIMLNEYEVVKSGEMVIEWNIFVVFLIYFYLNKWYSFIV